MSKFRVSVVSFANSIPFVHGLWNSPAREYIELSLDIPSTCADKLHRGEVEIGLIPTVELSRGDGLRVVSDLCIGADGKVETVILSSRVPLDQIRTVYLDYQSRTSVMLLKILSRYHWKKNFVLENTYPGFEKELPSLTDASLVIGDRAFEVNSPYKYDLATEWMSFSGLPFVFAVWASRIELPTGFSQVFNQALHQGVNNITQAIQTCNNILPKGIDLENYLRHCISYPLDKRKKEGMELFLTLCNDFQKAIS